MRYVYRDGNWVHPDTGEPMEIPERDGIQMPAVQSDLPGYMSVVTNKWIEGRTARRYDLESTGSRPAEPVAKKDRYCTSKKWAEKLGLEHNNAAGAGRPKHWDKDWSSTRIEPTE